MGKAGQLDALEQSIAGTFAEAILEFDGDAAVLRLEWSLLAVTGWFFGLVTGGAALLFTGAVLSITGFQEAARWSLAPGAALLTLVLCLTLLWRFAPLSALWPEVELRLAEREMVRRRARVPLDDLRPEHLVWRNGLFIRRLYVRHPELRGPLTAFFHSDQHEGEEFRQRLWELIRAPGPDVLGGDGGLTPVQRWLIGAGAPYGAINGFRVDRLGGAPDPSGTAADRRAAIELLQDPWGVHDLENLLAAINWLVQEGHRADFGRDADLAARPSDAQDEYGTLLREVDGLIAREQLDPPFVERLIELVRVRYGDEGDSYARLVPALLRDEPGADASEEGAELAQFLHQLFHDRDHAAEELRRLRTLADPALRANVGRFLIWDYGRALMLYRWGRMAGWLTEEYCWDRMLPLALDVQRRYSSWQDMATCYLQGRLLWSGGGGDAQAEYERIVGDLTTDPRSPWNLVPWDLELTRDW